MCMFLSLKQKQKSPHSYDWQLTSPQWHFLKNKIQKNTPSFFKILLDGLKLLGMDSQYTTEGFEVTTNILISSLKHTGNCAAVIYFCLPIYLSRISNLCLWFHFFGLMDLGHFSPVLKTLRNYLDPTLPVSALALSMANQCCLKSITFFFTKINTEQF